MTDWGFDLTDFGSPDNFRKVLGENGLKFSGRRKRESGIFEWVWKGKDVELVTANNPLTGKYAQDNYRKDEKGYASYMGMTGSDSAVRRLVESIKNHATSIKDESKGVRDFI